MCALNTRRKIGERGIERDEFDGTIGVVQTITTMMDDPVLINGHIQVSHGLIPKDLRSKLIIWVLQPYPRNMQVAMPPDSTMELGMCAASPKRKVNDLSKFIYISWCAE